MTKVHDDNTCVVTPLVSSKGRAGSCPEDKVVNRARVKVHGKPVFGFWLGCRVLKLFNNKPFVGVVDDVELDEGQPIFHVTFSDFDEMEMNAGEVWDSAIYHPRLEIDDEDNLATPLPDLDSFVLFSLNQQPRIGQVVEIRNHDQRPIVVQLWKPHRRVKDFISARFAPHSDGDEPSLQAMTAARIRVSDLRINDRGYFFPGSKKALRKCLRSWAAST